MAAKLKSILEPVPWLLVAKAIVFSAAWYFLPFWVFLIVASYFYFFPIFQSGKFLASFLITVYLAFLNEPNIWLAILLGLVFYLTIGIKDLIFVNRKISYTILIFTLFLLFTLTFWKINSFWDSNLLLKSVLLPIVFFLLTKNYLDEREEFESKRKFLILGLTSLFVWQFALVIIFLPLNRFYSSLILLAEAMIFLEIMPDYLNKNLDKRKKLTFFSLLFILIILILGFLETLV